MPTYLKIWDFFSREFEKKEVEEKNNKKFREINNSYFLPDGFPA